MPSAPVAPPIANHVATAPPSVLDPLLVEPASSRSCVLRWEELKGAMPPVIELSPVGSKRSDKSEESDECAEGFDPATITCEPGSEDCFTATMRGGHEATLSVLGPEGSGRFETLGLSIDGARFTCMITSTVGWRYLFPVGKMLAPLPWLADVDGDKEAELIVWARLPWGDSEVTNALAPVVYVLDGDRLVRRDDKAKALRVKVADAYHALANLGENPEARACFNAVTTAFGG
ncbi:MAG TPA: hypothetical protein VL326_34670 [Kofleriaceae bacterium]|nr:hypothetical protein [Kofleriaceae bacterium]